MLPLEMPSIIYHYCNKDVLESILKSHEIHLTFASNVRNDPEECRHKDIEEIICNELIKRDVKLYELYRLNQTMEPCLACFSDYPNEYLMTNYIGNNGGIIGFDVEELKKNYLIPNNISGMFAGRKCLSLNRVIYYEKTKNLQQQISTLISDIMRSKDLDSGINLICSINLLHLSRIFKPIKYSKEIEYRLIMVPWPLSPRELPNSLSNLKTKKICGKQMRYIPLPFSDILVKNVISTLPLDKDVYKMYPHVIFYTNIRPTS
ncbi:MAG: hypothetical protein AMJ43_04925 [Coxiella sp. DG_40]|nr:MAG: hypothetical protein AMJ43_04925 [Coxiella sp. DG_40]